MNRSSYRRSRLEALVAALIWLVAGVWTVGVSYFLGYGRPAKSFAGVPEWVLWGIAAPWAVFFIVHCWYSLCFLEDDDQDRGDPT